MGSNPPISKIGTCTLITWQYIKEFIQYRITIPVLTFLFTEFIVNQSHSVMYHAIVTKTTGNINNGLLINTSVAQQISIGLSDMSFYSRQLSGVCISCGKVHLQGQLLAIKPPSLFIASRLQRNIDLAHNAILTPRRILNCAFFVSRCEGSAET